MARKIILQHEDRQADEMISTEHKKTVSLSVKQARIIAQGHIADIKRSQKYHEDNASARGALEDLVQDLIGQDRQIGSPDDFHNFAVALAGSDHDALACLVLDTGLRCFPLNTDLLSDFLIYGIDCERMSDCKKHFETLLSVPKSDWTWRGFSFSIAYLTRLQDFAITIEERNSYKKQISQLAKDYKKYFPHEEGGYRESAKIHSKNPEKELQLLNEALSNDYVGACPACALRSADILFEQKKYAEALMAINRSLEDANNQTQGGVNEFYLYFLSGLCKLALSMNGKLELSEDSIIDVYADFNTALVGLSGEYCETIRKKVQILEQRTSIRVPDNFEKLLDLIGY